MTAYRLTQAASDDIEHIFRESLSLFGLGQADRYHAGLTATFEFLADFPRAARLREEINPPVRAFKYKSHLVIYELDDHESVVVLRVRHGHEDWLAQTDNA